MPTIRVCRPRSTPKANLPPGPRTGTRREASVGRAGGGRPLHPEPDQVIIAQAKTCPHCGGAVQAHEQHLHAVYDKIELPPVKPIVTRVEQYAGQCPHCGQSYVAPVPVGMEPGTPFGASIAESGDLPAVYPCHQLRAAVRALHAGVWGAPSVKGRWPTSSSG